ncbi:LPXTG cell wall anchor domain-containing protein [Aerococcaceae bacterium zg-ZJ1578]|uniref:LPXTG cell wall anchor domain-containing protein n=1 Tax=Aerococcaceae bacterium zg-252 TaxID=2796928 RepID=UPI001A24C368|nr:LPXTG cell wall anchor domain-containing protein [Aerococcaceae bacterium zg-1578]
MWKRIIVSSLVSLVIVAPIVQAVPVVEPYILTTSINMQPVEKHDCLILLQNQVSEVEKEEIIPQATQLKERLTELEANYQALNQQIHEIQSEGDESIDAAMNEIEKVIEQLYQQYLTSDEQFNQLDETQQLALIEQDEVYVEWQKYLKQLTDKQNELIANREQIETEYQQIVYQLEEETTQSEQVHANSEQLNQCLMYPYSVPQFAMESLFLNAEEPSLNAYLAQLDLYLQKLVPYAYRKLEFERIHQAFQRCLSAEALEQALYGKQHIVIDPLALQQYSYAKELSSFDVDIVANLAQRSYLNDKDSIKYLESYHELLNLKEMQFQYFYAINEAVWEQVKQQLVDYLNAGHHTSEAAINAIKQLHQRYQIKLGLYNENQGVWIVSNPAETGYIEEFFGKELAEVEPVIEETTPEEITTSQAVDTTTSGDKLVYLKEKLAQQTKQPNSKSLPKPSGKVGNKKENTSINLPSKNVKLPTTGEQQQAMSFALIILVIGAVLLLINRIKKRKVKEDIEKIELD